MSVLVRPAGPMDRDALLAIHCASWRDAYRGTLPEEVLGPGLEAQHGALWERIFATPVPGRLILTATDQDGPIGFMISLPDADDVGIDYMAALHVDPARRDEGVGALLMREWADRMTGIGRRKARLIVADDNHGARRFYTRLGAVEGPVFQDDITGHGDGVVAARVMHWDNLADIAILARGEAIRRLAPPASVIAAEQPQKTGAPHPVDSGSAAAARRKQTLGNLFGLSDFGVNRVEIDAGVRSTVRHFHSHEDEFILVLEGELTLCLDTGETTLGPGACAGFPAGTGPSHVLENRGSALAVYLEVGARKPDRDVTRYPGEDLMVARAPDGDPWFQRLDGTLLFRAG
ncbi:MAG: GNAT family N-acetyltransferase [Pseudomonadota bacterium]